ncbi:uncharacterized protein F5Z01DRAFT_654418 [Emericellopsis atlantica]|uniref:Uncharacterized protein n=1 Tax=Emericellopsis atlantica TaxID=2614577 RepID=A0A9P7ZMY9_9HYPO|nr:uncharacterized protein F5Z01DRAFT_654418 [Emericellopsis atlantica]KAG9254646.1 hypothetical protein F5Z01DRAFT_654418 [Emericellopsis atlantica]
MQSLLLAAHVLPGKVFSSSLSLVIRASGTTDATASYSTRDCHLGSPPHEKPGPEDHSDNEPSRSYRLTVAKTLWNHQGMYLVGTWLFGYGTDSGLCTYRNSLDVEAGRNSGEP